MPGRTRDGGRISPGCLRITSSKFRHEKVVSAVDPSAGQQAGFKGMRLALFIDGSCVRRWHLQLLERLAAIDGLQPSVALSARNAPGAGFDHLFRLEALIHGLAMNGPTAPMPASALTPYRDKTPANADLMLDLCGGAAPAGVRLWRLMVDGRAGEAALLDALLAGRAPLAEIVEGDRLIAAGRLGTENGGVVLCAFADVLDRLSTLIVAALSGGGARVAPLPDEESSDEPTPPAGSGALAKAAVKEVMTTLASRLYHLCYHAPHWRVGWRKLDGPDLFDLRRHPDAGWRELADDGQRFYADPFPIVHDGRVTLFVEDYDHYLRKGVISAVAFGPDGPLGVPQRVLEQDGHLSYPFVFERDGEVWMIPESCSAARVDLFRATAFPGGWVREATLIEGVVASDATLIEHDGHWWLFATVRDGGGAFSDALCLWSAPDFRGPWTAHPRNPVLIDIASARPAGRMIFRDGSLLRPVQDCRSGYGRALGIARVTRLDEGGFQQEVETIIRPGQLWSGRRLHTLNSAGGFEFIDGSAFARPRFMGPRATLPPAAGQSRIDRIESS